MYVHQQAWDEAQRVAELHCPESVADVLIGQVKQHFNCVSMLYISITTVDVYCRIVEDTRTFDHLKCIKMMATLK